MGKRIREYDWSQTPVGPIDTWPASLCNAVNIVLSTRFPMFIWWGEELTQFYNDAYRPSLGENGKHPSALGQPGKDCWPEIWPVIYPLIRQVLDTGEATWSENQLIPIYRNGRLEDVYWTFGYSPLVDEQGIVRGVLVVCTENTDNVLSVKKLTESEDRARLAIESADLGTYEIDLTTGSMRTSARFNEIWGVQPPIDVDRKNAMIHPDDFPYYLQALEEGRRTGRTRYEIRVVRPDGALRWVRMRGMLTFDAEGRAINVFGLSQDITSEKLATDNLNRLVAERTRELERSNEDLLQFAHVISHDLKEPVRKIQLFTSRLAEESGDRMPGKGNIYLGKIHHASNRIASMIEGVLAYSSLGAQQGNFAPVDLAGVMRQVLDDLELLIQQKQALIEVSGLGVVTGNPILLYQLLYNLVNNSLKFSRPGVTPRITVSATRTPDGPRGFETIVIEDNGIGFEAEHAGQIFEPFTRLHSKDAFEGTGLGLSLSQKIVERHGGSISAASGPGMGAKFIFTLPGGAS